MIKCPFCGFDNEDGALFCEQCKSDLSSVAPAAAPPPPPPAAHAHDAPGHDPHGHVPVAHVEEHVPMAAVIDAPPGDIPVAPIVEENVPMAAVVEAAPVHEAPPAHLPEPPHAPIHEPPHAPAAEAHAPPMPPPSAPTPPPASAPAAAAPAPAAPAAAKNPPPAGSEPKLLVIRGAKVNVEFPIYPGQNFIGRSDEKPVDIDLEDQEPPDRVWTSRQHAVLEWDDAAGALTLEDLNSSNGTYLNRARVYPGQKQSLNVGDVVQIGTIHLRVKV